MQPSSLGEIAGSNVINLIPKSHACPASFAAEAIQAACRIFANDLEPDIQEMQEREIEARIRKQLEEGGSTGL